MKFNENYLYKLRDGKVRCYDSIKRRLIAEDGMFVPEGAAKVHLGGPDHFDVIEIRKFDPILYSRREAIKYYYDFEVIWSDWNFKEIEKSILESIEDMGYYRVARQIEGDGSYRLIAWRKDELVCSYELRNLKSNNFESLTLGRQYNIEEIL